MTGVLLIGLAVLNVLLIFVFTSAPIGHRKVQVSRRIQADRTQLWEALWPLGENASWENKIIEANALEEDQAVLKYSWPARDGSPIERRVVMEEVVPGEKFTLRIAEDSSLEQSFWKDFRETTELLDNGDGTVTVTITAHDKYKGLAFPVFRFFSLRRTISRLKDFAEKGNFNPIGIFEHPLSQLGFAAVSTLLIWPLFGMSQTGFMLAATLTLVVALHELGHMFAFRIMGHKSARMIFIPILGGIAIGGRPYDSRYEIAFVALMGAGFSALLVVPAILGSHAADLAGFRGLGAGLAIFAGFCAIFNLANLVPVWKFDGGQILRQLFQDAKSQLLGSAIIFACIFSTGIVAGVSIKILVSFGAMFAALSVLTSNIGAKPRHAMKPMSKAQYLGMIAGLALVFAIHSAGIMWAVQRFFG
jgi:Zn-dependent protease